MKEYLAVSLMVIVFIVAVVPLGIFYRVTGKMKCYEGENEDKS